MKYFLVLSLVLLAGCASMVKMDHSYLAQNASRVYNHPKSKCYDSAKHVLMDMGGKVTKEDKNKGIFISNRYNIHKIITALRDKHSAIATSIKEDHKLYVKVTGSKSKCEVAFIKYRVWSNNRELHEINENFIKRRVFEPFLAEIKLQLEDNIL